VVDGARLESETGEQHQATPKPLNAYAIGDLPSRIITRCASENVNVLRGFEGHVSQFYHNRHCQLANTIRTPVRALAKD
jgi:hypothetical protein